MRLDFKSLHFCELGQLEFRHRVENASTGTYRNFKTFLNRLFVEMTYEEKVLAFNLIV